MAERKEVIEQEFSEVERNSFVSGPEQRGLGARLTWNVGHPLSHLVVLDALNFPWTDVHHPQRRRHEGTLDV